MLTFQSSTPPLFRVSVHGRVTREEVRAFYARLDPALDRAGRAGMLVDLSRYSEITPAAALEDVVQELEMLDRVEQIPRCAVVTRNRMLAGVIEYLSPIVPSMEMRAFAPTDLPEAKDWARAAVSRPH